MNLHKNDKEFSVLISLIVEKLENETVIKILEISLDLIELLLSSLPECIIQFIQQILFCFLKQLSSRREMIADKANDLINLARETLGPDYLLPHFINILTELVPDMSQIKTKISALEVLDVLLLESESINNSQDSAQQFAIVIKTLGSMIKQHS